MYTLYYRIRGFRGFWSIHKIEFLTPLLLHSSLKPSMKILQKLQQTGLTITAGHRTFSGTLHEFLARCSSDRKTCPLILQCQSDCNIWLAKIHGTVQTNFWTQTDMSEQLHICEDFWPNVLNFLSWALSKPQKLSHAVYRKYLDYEEV